MNCLNIIEDALVFKSITFVLLMILFSVAVKISDQFISFYKVLNTS